MRRDEQKQQQRQQQDTSLMILKTKMSKKIDILWFSVYQSAAEYRKGQENCQINVDCGLKATKENL